MNIHFILASQSPRRHELLQLLGWPFQIQVANADEDSVTHPDPATNVIQTARLKASVIAQQLEPKTLALTNFILAADTTVALGRKMLNKPADETAAFQMLTELRGTQHEVHTGFVLLELATGREWEGVSTAVVTMRNYSKAELHAYIASGDPFDKAGGYAIQHPQFKPVASLQGCYCNVMGLPVCELIVTLNQIFGLPINQINFTAVSEAHKNYPCPTLKRLLSNLYLPGR